MYYVNPTSSNSPSRAIDIDPVLDCVVNAVNRLLALSVQFYISLERFCLHGFGESVVIVDQQLQTCQHHRYQTGLLEVGLLRDQHLNIVGDGHAHCLNHGVEDSARVFFVELRCEVGVHEAFAVGEVDCSDCCENLLAMLIVPFVCISVGFGDVQVCLR